MNLVTREEFESSMQLLEEARAKLADLESRLDELQSD
jgi:BMFP domain-containing protein YqiC